MNVRLRVIRDTTERIGDMPELLDEGLHDIANWAAGTMVELAREAVPKRTGQLSNMIVSLVERVGSADDPAFRAIVGVPLGSKGHGAFVEFGTGRRGIFSHAIYGRKYGWPHIDYTRNWMGQVAQPYLTPQPFAVKDEVDKRMMDLLHSLWNGGPG